MTNFYTYDIPFLKNSTFGPTFDNGDLENEFSSRESYLNWRAEWKAAYKELSKQIRHAKHNRSPLRMKDNTYRAEQWALRAECGGELATRMIAFLHSAKVYAGELREARRVDEDKNREAA